MSVKSNLPTHTRTFLVLAFTSRLRVSRPAQSQEDGLPCLISVRGYVRAWDPADFRLWWRRGFARWRADVSAQPQKGGQR